MSSKPCTGCRFTPRNDAVLLASGHYWVKLIEERGAVNWYLAPDSGQTVYKQSSDGSNGQFQDLTGMHYIRTVSDSTATIAA